MECSRINAREWNKNHREHCRIMNRKYHLEKKKMIQERKKRNYFMNPEKGALQARRYILQKNYNMSVEDYENILARQKGVCAICLREETQRSNKNGKIDSLRVDHCHTTNRVRGLLCSKCNFGIGQFNDDVELLYKAIKYLKEKQQVPPTQKPPLP
jgi:hypothetical protein